MRLASGLRLLPCTAACLRSTAGPVATARPCRPTTLPLRDNSMAVQPTPTPCSARVPAASALHSRSGGILVYLRSPSFYPKFRGQSRSVLNAPEQRKTPSSHRGGSRLATLPVSCPPPTSPSTCPTSIISASAGLYVSNQYCISLCRLVRVHQYYISLCRLQYYTPRTGRRRAAAHLPQRIRGLTYIL